MRKGLASILLFSALRTNLGMPALCAKETPAEYHIQVRDQF